MQSTDYNKHKAWVIKNTKHKAQSTNKTQSPKHKAQTDLISLCFENCVLFVICVL